jgi:hypothetical protein
MTRHDEMLLRTAVESLQSDEPDAAQITASARRVADRLGMDGVVELMSSPEMETIRNCDDVKRLMPSYQAGTLSKARSLLIKAHLRDCGVCLRRSQSDAALDWSTPKATRAFVWRPRAISWAFAPALALLVCSFFVYKVYWQIPPGVRAEVQSIDGSAYRISKSGDRAGNRQLSPGDQLAEGDFLRTSGGGHAVLRLSDGSTIEVNERSVLGVGARGRNMTISLDNGAVIVQAAKRSTGHLYVKTPDCRVAVTGTVFSVNSGIKGSRVAVLQGSVQMMHGGVDTLMHAGDQVATYDNPSPAPGEEQIAQQISWSHDRDKYLPLLAQFALLQHRLEKIPSPQARYSSDLLQRVPADTLLYVSIPNLGDYLSEANKVFQDQLTQSPVLQQWWERGHSTNSVDPTAELDSLVNKLHQMSQYLGDEVVVVGIKQTHSQGIAVMADVQKSGLDDFLRTQSPFSDSNHGLVVFDETSLGAASISSTAQSGGYALIRQHEAVFSNSVATLKQIDMQLNAGASGFASGAFGQQIAAAYTRGAGVILAADLHQMIASQPNVIHARQGGQVMLDKSGMEDVQYLIAEHRETNGVPQNHLNLQFSGTRQRVASWLAAPAPIGSLDFVTPNASIVVALLSKDPKSIADDLIAMAVPDENQKDALDETEAKLQVNFRDDIAANLGGDFLLSVDGPVLPTPSWKAVIEVRNPEQLETTLERIAQSVNSLAREKGAHTIAIESSEAGGQRYYSLRDVTLGSIVAQYTFADGYMIVAPIRALLIEALQTHTNGDSLARSASFKALLPKDENENYSAVAYQNLGPVMTPLLSQVSGETAIAIRQLAADSRPTAICAWGKDSRIEAASDSHLFGFDFLTLGTLIHSGNNHAGANVRE